MNETFEFTLDKIVYNKNDFIIARVFSKSENIKQYLNPTWRNVSIKGKMQQLKSGILYNATIEDIESNQYGYTLSVHSVHAPHFQSDNITTDKMMCSFVSCFVGDGTAEKIKNVKGICQIIKNEDIDSLMRIKGIGEATANKILSTYKKEAVGSKYIIQLKEIGLTDNEINKTKEYFKNDLTLAYNSIKKNIFELNYFRFDRADNIFLNYLEGSPKDKRRIKAYINKALKEYLFEDYRSYVSIREFDNSPIITNIISNTNEQLYRQCIRELANEDKIKIINEKYVTTGTIYKYDVSLYKELNRLMGINNKRNLNVDIDELIKEEERVYNVELNDGQKNAIKEILQHNVSLLTGGGGTGKSFSTRILLNIIEKIQGENFKPTLCALSGKASKVLANSTGREAKTIHRTLGFAKGGFSHSENDKLDTSILIVDEISMCPNDLLSMLLTALEEGTYVLFIGDDNQLTSIGFSNSIHDFTKMKNMNCINLTQPMRQAMKSGILEICTSIRNETNPFAKKKEYTYGELQDMNVVIGDKYNEMINNFVNAFDVNNKLDYVALGCTKKLTSKINLDIQRGLIKKGKLKEDEDFIEVFTELKDDNNKKIRMKLFKGDVCLIVKNNYNILTFDEFMNNLEYGSATLFNGNTVIIKEVYTDACLIETEDGEELVIRDESYEIIAPGYSYSIHKSQGSSIKHCYIYLENNYVTKNMLLVNEALYTAISRAKSTCEMYVEDYSVLSKAIKNKEINNRQTILELLIDGLIKLY